MFASSDENDNGQGCHFKTFLYLWGGGRERGEEFTLKGDKKKILIFVVHGEEQIDTVLTSHIFFYLAKVLIKDKSVLKNRLECA